MPVSLSHVIDFPALERLRLEDLKFEASLENSKTLSQKRGGG
jgi:hypothetical protein